MLEQNSPKYLRLARDFERQLRTGVLRVGDRLPSVRQLSDEHRVSAATAVGCYMWLERQGYVRARPKSGFYVSRTPLGRGLEPAVGQQMQGPMPIAVRPPGPDECPAGDRTGAIEMGSAIVGAAFLPMNRLNRSIRTALSAFSDHAVRYEDPRGNVRLRRQIARLLFRQGASCSPDDLIVTSGSTEALHLSVRAVTKPGDIVAVESPCCFEMLNTLEALHLRVLEVPHIRHLGIDLTLLESAVTQHRVTAVIMNATCHNPLGDCVPDPAKAAIVAFATSHDIAVIEGDTFGELVFSGERPRPLKAFDTSGQVLQCGSLAHYVAPGFNLGWSNAGRWQAEVQRLKALTNISSARLPQLALAEFLESGGFEKHVKQLRVALSQSVESSREEVLRTFPDGTRVSRPEGGFVLWIQLPAGHDGADVQRRAAERGVHILAGELFSASGQYKDCIRISCGHPFEVLRPGIRTLAALLG